MRITAIIVLLLVLACSVCLAAESQTVSLDAKDMSMSEVAAEIGKQAGVQIVCDSDIKGSVTGSFASIKLESLLDTVTKSNKLTWQKLYLPTPGDQKPTLEQIKARAKAVAAVTGGTIVVCDPATGKQKVFVEQETTAPSVEPEKLGLKPIYLISKPRVETAADTDAKSDTSARIQALEMEKYQLLAQMTPEQRVQALQSEMNTMLNLAPDVREQMILAQMNARRNMDPQMRRQYQQMMRDTMQSLRDQGLITGRQGGGFFGGGGRNGGGGRGNNGNGN